MQGPIELNNYGPGIVANRFVVTFSDLTTAGSAQTLNLPTLGAGFGGSTPTVPVATMIMFVRIKHTTAFSGGGLSGMTVSVGSSAGSATTFAAAFNVFQAVANTTFQAAAASNLAATYAADTITVTFTATGGNVNAATAGSVNVDIFFWLEPDLTATAPLTNSPTPQGSGGSLL